MQINTVVTLLLGVVTAGSDFDRYNEKAGKTKRVHYTDRPKVQMHRQPNGKLTVHIVKNGKVQVKENRGFFYTYFKKPFYSMFGSRHPHPYAVHRFHLKKQGLVNKARAMLKKLQKMSIGPKFCKQVNEINKVLLQVDRNSTGVRNPACINYQNMKHTMLVHPAAKQKGRRRGFLGRFRREKTFYRYDRDYNHLNGKYVTGKHRDPYGYPGKKSTKVTHSNRRSSTKQKSKVTYWDHHGQKHKVKQTVGRDGSIKVNHKVKGSTCFSKHSHGKYRRDKYRRGGYRHSSVKRSYHGGYKSSSVQKSRHSDCKIRHRDYNSPSIKIRARDSNYGTGSYKIRSRHDAPCKVKKSHKHGRRHVASTRKVQKYKKSKKSKHSHVYKPHRQSVGSFQSQQLESKVAGMCDKMLAFIRSSRRNGNTVTYRKKRTSFKHKSSKCKHVKAGSPRGNQLIHILRARPQRCSSHHVKTAKHCHYARVRHGKHKKGRGKRHSTVRWYKTKKNHKGYCVHVVRRREIVTQREVLRGKN